MDHWALPVRDCGFSCIKLNRPARNRRPVFYRNESLHKVERIVIIGCPGSGKSTLARELGEKLNLTVIHLDRLWWTRNWQNVSMEELDEATEEYERDLNKGLKIDEPYNYFKNGYNNGNYEIVKTWSSSANLIYVNWLNYYVYQITPFNIDEVNK